MEESEVSRRELSAIRLWRVNLKNTDSYEDGEKVHRR